MDKQEMWVTAKNACGKYLLNDRQKADIEVAKRAFMDFGNTEFDAHNLMNWAIVCGNYIELGKMCDELSRKVKKTLLKTHKCKYCGQVAEGEYEDLLCEECRADFGHSLFSEL